MVRLKIYDGQERIQEFQLGSEVVTIGRDPGNNLILPDVSVSRHHAQIEPSGNFFLLRDHGSTNGTFVNELLVRLHVLSHGDTLRVGKYVLLVDARPPTSSDTTRVRVEELRLPDNIFAVEREVKEGGGRRAAILAETSREQLLRLFEIQNEIGHVDVTETLLGRALDLVMDDVGADRGSILLGTEEPLCRAPREGVNRAPLFFPASVRSRKRAAGAAQESGKQEPAAAASAGDLVIPEVLLIQAAQEKAGFLAELPSAQGASESKRSCLVCPLRDKNSVLGVIYLDRSPERPAFGEGDLQTLSVVAGQIAISLANAKLFAEISEEKEKVQAIVTNLTDGVLVTDAAFTVIEANRAATILLGLRDRNPLGASLFTLFEGFKMHPEAGVLAASSLREDGVFHLALGGSEREFLEACLIGGKITPYPKGASPPRGLIVTLRDLSTTRQIEELKTQFVEKVAHKLRSPLTVIQGNLPLLREAQRECGKETAVAHEILAEVERNSNILRRLIDQFIAFIEEETRSTRLAILPQPASLKAIVREAVRCVQPAASRKGTLVVERLSEDQPWLAVHSDLLLRAFEEVLKNAVAFSSEAGLVVVEAEESNGYLRLDFLDNGPGIPREEAQSVFYICHQVDAERTGQVPGAGLGLTIARHIVQQHGGEISITSPFGFPDHGTRVSIFLPLGETGKRAEGRLPEDAGVTAAGTGAETGEVAAGASGSRVEEEVEKEASR